MNELKRRNYHKETGYAAQAKYYASHYKTVSVKIPIAQKAVLDEIAKANGVSVGKLIKDALLEVYHIDCSTNK